jgi:hypothetical protein
MPDARRAGRTVVKIAEARVKYRPPRKMLAVAIEW